MLILILALHDREKNDRIDVVIDVYRKTSIKNTEICNCGSDDSPKFKNIALAHTIHQWRKFLGSSANETSLISFLIAEWEKADYRQKLNDKLLYTTYEDHCFKITKDNWI